MNWEYFSEVDDRMNDEFMQKLVGLRRDLNLSLPVTSSFRTAEHNARVGGSKNSAHLLGRAVDIQIAGSNAFYLVQKAFIHGMTGIGIKQHSGWPGRFIHLDDIEDPSIRPRIWTY